MLQRVLHHHGLMMDRYHLHDVQHRPGAGATGVFEVHAAPAGGPEHEYFVALTCEDVPAEASLPAGEAAGAEWSAWFHPHDPCLPGLALAADPDSVQSLWGQEDRLVSLRTLGYRPLRRAVLRAVFRRRDGCGSRSAFLKVMRDGRAVELHRRHLTLAAAGVPVPTALGPPLADVLALEEGQGTLLSSLVLEDGAAAVDPAEITGVLDRMPPACLQFPRRPAWSDHLAAYGRAAGVVLPAEVTRIRRLAQRIDHLLRTTDRGPLVPTHGDLYEANLLMEAGRISCLLDVDGTGPGHRVDDLACFLGHLAVLPTVDRRYVHAPAALRRFHAHFATTVDPAALAGRTSAVALSLVAGARDLRGGRHGQRVARERLTAAEAMLELPH